MELKLIIKSKHFIPKSETRYRVTVATTIKHLSEEKRKKLEEMEGVIDVSFSAYCIYMTIGSAFSDKVIEASIQQIFSYEEEIVEEQVEQ